MKYILLGNTIELLFNDFMQGERYIEYDINYSTQISVTTHGITNVLVFKDEEELRVFQQIIFNDIIIKIKTKAQEKHLDFIQIIIINGVKCAFIDNGINISIIATGEY